MENYLESRIYVYRKSFKYFNKMNITMHLGEIIFSCSSLSAFVCVPLASLALCSTLLMGLHEVLNIKEKMIEFKKCYNFYKDLLLLYKANQINDESIFSREREFIDSIKYFAVEKYLKKKKLNGYL